ARARFERGPHRRQMIAEPAAELGRRGLRIRDDQDLLDAEPRLEEEPHVELRDRERLPGARAGLDRDQAAERHGERIERRVRATRRHDPLRSASRIGPRMRSTSRRKSSPIGSTPRNASWKYGSSPSPPQKSDPRQTPRAAPILLSLLAPSAAKAA